MKRNRFTGAPTIMILKEQEAGTPAWEQPASPWCYWLT